MRAFGLLLVVVLAVFLVVRFYPASSDSAQDQAHAAVGEVFEPGGTAAAQPRFLSRPEPDPQEESPLEQVAPRDPDPSLGAEDSAAAGRGPVQSPGTEAGSARPSWLDDVRPATAVPRSLDEIQVAAEVLHGSPESVARRLAGVEASFSEDRGRLIVAFCHAVAGGTPRALEIAREIRDEAALDPIERQLFQAAVGGAAVVAQPAAMASVGPVALAFRLALLAREAELYLAQKRYPTAAVAYSELILGELDAPWDPGREALWGWAEQLNKAQENHRWDPHGDWPHRQISVEPGDSLSLIRQRYLRDHPGAWISAGLIQKANRIRGYIQPGDKLRIPTDEVSVLVDLEGRLLVFLFDGEAACAWKVGVGRPGEETLEGDFTVGVKLEDPMWTRVGQAPVPASDPKNPLGTRWITWMRDGRKTSYGFHGNNDPASIGQADSEGCIRMHNPEVEVLFEILPVGAPIHVRE